ncbi:MAG TPA: Flp family type IVb pilin [Alphaproteobacteria bacterium]|nr:Flp family type IVb pilin [Alphaproteobacteria bacterium]
MRKFLSRFASDESGATAIEYGLIAAGIAVAIITIVSTVGSDVNNTFYKVSSGLSGSGS